MKSHEQIIFSLCAICWVGVLGYVMSRSPELFSKVNARFGVERLATARFARGIRLAGIALMILGLISAVSMLGSLALVGR